MVLHFHAHKLGSRVDLPDFLSRERAKGNLCDIKGLKRPLHQNKVSLFPGNDYTCRKTGTSDPPAALMKGGIGGVCVGRYELSLRICTGRGFTATLALIIVARCLHRYHTVVCRCIYMCVYALLCNVI